MKGKNMKEVTKLLFTAIALFAGCSFGAYVFLNKALIHRCPPPTRQAIQRHWIEVHDANHKIANTLDSKMLDICSRECDYGYWEMMEENERNMK